MPPRYHSAVSDAPPEFRPPAGPRITPRTVGIAAVGLAALAVLVALLGTPATPERPEALAPGPTGAVEASPASAPGWGPSAEDPLEAATRDVQEAVAARARARISMERARASGADPEVLEALQQALGGPSERPGAEAPHDDEGPVQLEADGPLIEGPRPGDDRAL